jgi:hypothetical protein
MRKYSAAMPLLLLAACVAPQPAPPPAPPAPPPPTPVPPPPVSLDWRDWPLTPGSWIYRADAAGSSALFGRAGAEANLILRCDLASRTIMLSWPGAAASAVTITTSHGVGSYQAAPAAGTTGRIGISFAARDPFLDKLSFSRGRFVVASVGGGAAAGEPAGRLVIPAWPEPARAVEDCRK